MRLLVSLTAHERLDVLWEQLQNITLSRHDAVVVVHLNPDFRAAVEADAAQARLLALMCRQDNLVLNPESLPTRWAHMFHAHVANLRHAFARGIGFDYLVLLSSGDLFIRPGCEDYIARFDAGNATGPISPQGYWSPAATTDPVLMRMAADGGAALPLKSLHEGSFYRRALVVELLRLLDRYVTDWNYDDRYSKEEFFFPTLLLQLGPMRRGWKLAQHGGLTEPGEDRVAMARILAARGAPLLAQAPLLRAWVAAALAESGAAPELDPHCHILSRIPRSSASLVRQVVGCLAQPYRLDLAAAAVRHLPPLRLLELEAPARTNMHAEVSAFTAAAVRRAPRHEAFGPAQWAGQPPASFTLGACPGGYAPVVVAAPGLYLCGRWLGGATTVALAPGPAGLGVTVAAPAPAGGCAFLFGLMGAAPVAEGAVLLDLAGTATGLTLWLEEHWPDGDKRVFPLAASRAPEGLLAPASAELRAWLDGPRREPGQWLWYLGLEPGHGPVELRRLALVG